MSNEPVSHSIKYENFYPLNQAELAYVRSVKNKNVPILLAIGSAIIVLAAILSYRSCESVSDFFRGLAFGLVFGGIFLVLAIFKILDAPVGGRYGTIVSCYTVKEITGSGDDRSTHTYYHFTVRLDDTGNIIEDFVGTMYSKTMRTGARVLVVENRITTHDVFLADDLIQSGVYYPPSDETDEFKEVVREHRGTVSDIKDLEFYDLSDDDIQVIKNFRKKYYAGTLIGVSVAIVFFILLGFLFNGFIHLDSIILRYISGMIAVSLGIIALLRGIDLMCNLDKKYSARHVIIRNMKTESVMNLTGDSHQEVFYIFETTDTQEILNEVTLDDKGVWEKSIGTEVMLTKDKKGRYSIFNIL